MTNEDNFEKVLVLSKAHMPNSNPDFGNVRHQEHKHGFIVFVFAWRSRPFDEEAAWIRPILAEAWKNECSLVNFDADAPTYDGLKTWDW